MSTGSPSFLYFILGWYVAQPENTKTPVCNATANTVKKRNSHFDRPLFGGRKLRKMLGACVEFLSVAFFSALCSSVDDPFSTSFRVEFGLSKKLENLSFVVERLNLIAAKLRLKRGAISIFCLGQGPSIPGQQRTDFQRQNSICLRLLV